MPLDLNALQVFLKVVQTGSFTLAARALGMPKSTASQRVAELEQHLGARLMQRTTRALSLTDEGRIYFDHCLRIFAEVEQADRAVVRLQERPYGLLRITVPASTQFLGPVFASFLRRHRDVQLEVVCTDRSVDLIEEGFDLAIRAGKLSDSTLVARTLGSLRYALVASPRYLKKRGRPGSPDDLGRHDCIVFGAGPHAGTWRLESDQETREVSVRKTVLANDLDILRDAVLSGAGIAMLPAYVCADALQASELERVLPAWEVPAVPVQAVYPSGRHLSPKVKVMLDHLQQMASAPWSGPEQSKAAPSRARPRSKPSDGPAAKVRYHARS